MTIIIFAIISISPRFRSGGLLHARGAVLALRRQADPPTHRLQSHQPQRAMRRTDSDTSRLVRNAGSSLPQRVAIACPTCPVHSQAHSSVPDYRYQVKRFIFIYVRE